jgi:glutathione S-transferase
MSNTMPTYRLHYFPESGNSYKLALMLTLCGETFEPIWTDFGGGATRTAAWRNAVNEMGEIPVLEEDGVRLTQTAPILLMLAERYGRFGGETPAQKFEVLRWLFWDNHKLTGYMATYRFQRASRRRPIRRCWPISASASTTFFPFSSSTWSATPSRSATGRASPISR